MRTITPERGLKLESFKMHKKDTFMPRSRICRLHLEKDKVLGTCFVRCDMKDVTIPHAFVL